MWATQNVRLRVCNAGARPGTGGLQPGADTLIRSSCRARPQRLLTRPPALPFLPLVAERLKEAPYLLKQLYETDLVEEDVILAWAQKSDAGKLLGVPADGGKAVRKAVAQVVEWLQSQEDEEDEEDEDDE